MMQSWSYWLRAWKEARRHPRLTSMGQDRLSHGSELTVMEIGWLIRRAPHLACNEFPVPGEKARRTGRLIHVQRFLVRIIRPITHVVQFEIRERRHVHHA